MNLKNLKITPVLVLRLGLGFVFLYAGVMSFAAPENWIGFVPSWLDGLVEAQTFLYAHAVFGLALALVFLFPSHSLNFTPFLRLASFLAFLDFSAILIFFGVDDVTFRDFGLLMSALALFLLSAKPKRNSNL